MPRWSIVFTLENDRVKLALCLCEISIWRNLLQKPSSGEFSAAVKRLGSSSPRTLVNGGKCNYRMGKDWYSPWLCLIEATLYETWDVR